MKTAAQVRKELEEHGVTIAELARRHQIGRSVFADLLRGRTKGRWGEAHRAAVILGMKKQPKADTKAVG